MRLSWVSWDCRSVPLLSEVSNADTKLSCNGLPCPGTNSSCGQGDASYHLWAGGHRPASALRAVHEVSLCHWNLKKRHVCVFSSSEVNRCFLVVLMFICSEVHSAPVVGLERCWVFKDSFVKWGFSVTYSWICCMASKITHHGACPGSVSSIVIVSWYSTLLFPSELWSYSSSTV